MLPNLFREGAHKGKRSREKERDREKTGLQTERAALYNTHRPFRLAAARPARPAATTTTTAGAAAATTTFEGGQVWLGHPLHT